VAHGLGLRGRETAHKYQSDGYRGSDIAQDPLGGVVSSADRATTSSSICGGPSRSRRPAWESIGPVEPSFSSMARAATAQTRSQRSGWTMPARRALSSSGSGRGPSTPASSSNRAWRWAIHRIRRALGGADRQPRDRHDACASLAGGATRYELHMVHGGRGYAVLPASADSATCSKPSR